MENISNSLKSVSLFQKNKDRSEKYVKLVNPYNKENENNKITDENEP